MRFRLTAKAQTRVDEAAHLFLQALGIPTLPAPGTRVQADLAHEVV
jgi:hypothetical protein